MDSVQITGVKDPRRKIQSIKLIRNFLTERQGGGTMSLKAAKDLVDNYERGVPFPKMWIYQTLNNEFMAQFEYDEAPPLRLFRVYAEGDPGPAGGGYGQMNFEVIILSTSESSAKISTHTVLDKAHSGVAICILRAEEITKFRKNMVLAVLQSG